MRDVGVLWGAIYPGKTKLARERSYNIPFKTRRRQRETTSLCGEDVGWDEVIIQWYSCKASRTSICQKPFALQNRQNPLLGWIIPVSLRVATKLRFLE